MSEISNSQNSHAQPIVTTLHRKCRECKAEFKITAQDLAFYEKISPVFNGKKYLVPPPPLCPDCRRRKRLCWRNERKLYVRTCDLSHKKIISIYSPDKPYTVYEKDVWLSDKWDQHASGKDFDFKRSFFEQFNELMLRAPLPSLNNVNNENCEFVNLETNSKDCYMNVGGHFNRDCYYCTFSLEGKDCLDNYWAIKCELTYGSINLNQCYNSAFLQNCFDSSDCIIGFDLSNCQNCIGCIGLRNMNFHKVFHFTCSNHLNSIC